MGTQRGVEVESLTTEAGRDAHWDCSGCDSSSLSIVSLVILVSGGFQAATHCLSMWRANKSGRWKAFLQPSCVHR
jgi:hypothetical protein